MSRNIRTIRSVVLGSLVAVVSASGCSDAVGDTTLDITFSPCEPLVVVSPDASPGWHASIDEAVSMWNDVGAVHITTEPMPSASAVPIAFEEAALLFHGVYLDEEGRIIINENLGDEDDRAITIAHELGHALGFWHIEDRDSVMNPGNLTFRPSAEDADALFALWDHCAEGPRSLDTATADPWPAAAAP